MIMIMKHRLQEQCLVGEHLFVGDFVDALELSYSNFRSFNIIFVIMKAQCLNVWMSEQLQSLNLYYHKLMTCFHK